MDHVQSVKELARHLLFRTRALPLVYRLRKDHHSHVAAGPLSTAFERAYESQAWLVSEGQHSLSGPGSELAATSGVVSELPAVLAGLECKHLLDIGCGDYTWMKEVEFDGHYIGCDIVSDLISLNTTSYGSDRRRFMTLDATHDPLPPADVILCREVLFHLSFQGIRSLLKNVRLSSAKYFIATSDRSIWFNADIMPGDFRNLNLQKRPFRLPPPILTMDDGFVRPGRMLAVWAVEAIPRQ